MLFNPYEFGAIDWEEKVAGRLALVVSPKHQKIFVVDKLQVIKEFICSTAKNGLGNEKGSLKTPIGWHEIAKKIGEGAPFGAIFKSRQWTGQVWEPNRNSETDYILTRILWLSGIEKGYNCGGESDTKSRYIYFHGTNAEHALGRQESNGCIRMSNSDILEMFDLVQTGTPVLIANN